MKILMICTNPIFKYESGGTKWVLDGLVKLCSTHNDVVFLTGLSPKDKASLLNNDKGSGNTYHFRQGKLFGEYLHMFTDLNVYFWRKLIKMVNKENIDLIWVTMPYGIISASIICRSIPIIYDSHGISSDAVGISLATLQRHSQIFRMPIIKSIVKLILQGYISLVERLACNRATHIKAIAKTDRRRFIEKYGIDEDKITTISPFISSHELKKEPLKKNASGKTGRVTVVFHGSYNHPPNRDAFELISNYIAPQVAMRNNNIQFLLAGVGVPLFETKNLKSVGFVENIQGTLANSDIAIVPLLEGEGVKTKIFDYMVVGLPIISTRKGIQSIEAEDGKHVIILDEVDQKFINAILDLANDSERREVLGRNALELAKVKYSQESMQARMDELLAKAMESQRCRIIHKSSGL
jgi:glycosyltransferase involved in cell wall biosynthesis